MTLAEQIYTIVKTLPPEQASQVLTFAEAIRSQHLEEQPLPDPIELSGLLLKDALGQLHHLTHDLPLGDPVSLIRSGREALGQRR
jgi:hypothetical protein